MSRIKGESGEVVLRIGTSEKPFGLINVGDAKSLCDHMAVVAAQNDTTSLTIGESKNLSPRVSLQISIQDFPRTAMS